MLCFLQNFLKHFVKVSDTSECQTPHMSKEDLDRLNLTVKEVTHPNNRSAFEYECMFGFSPKYEGNFAYKCQDDGAWNNSNVPECVQGFQFFRDCSKYDTKLFNKGKLNQWSSR